MKSTKSSPSTRHREDCTPPLNRASPHAMWSDVRRCVFRATGWRNAFRGGAFFLATGAAQLGLGTFEVASAQAAESPEVEQLLAQGIELRRQGADERALKVFLEAEEKAPRSVRTMLHVATAAQAAGKWVLAASYLDKVSRYSNDPYYRRYRDSIAQVEKAIAQRVGNFQAVGGPEGATISVDGKQIGTLPMDAAIPMEAGTYAVEVTLDGYYPFTRSVAVAGGTLAREVVNLNELPEEEKLALAATVAPPLWWESSWLTWTLAGVGLLGGAAAGTAFALRQEEAKEWNGQGCLSPEAGGLATRRDLCGGVRDDIRTMDAVLIAGGATAAVFSSMALVQWLASQPKSSQPVDSAKKQPIQRAAFQCAPGVASILCQGAF